MLKFIWRSIQMSLSDFMKWQNKHTKILWFIHNEINLKLKNLKKVQNLPLIPQISRFFLKYWLFAPFGQSIISDQEIRNTTKLYSKTNLGFCSWYNQSLLGSNLSQKFNKKTRLLHNYKFVMAWLDSFLEYYSSITKI